MFKACRPASSSGLLRMMPWSLPNATTEPVKVTAPTNTPTKISISWMRASAPVRPVGGPNAEAKPTSTAAAPTKLWRMATSCGIAVISTRAARMAPMPPPTASMPAISP